jgi:lipopolysaccharide transport system permease protein
LISAAPGAVPEGAPAAELPELVIEPGARMAHYWRDLLLYRELFWFLAWRDVSVRYRQTVLGVAWSILRPLLTMVIFTVLFGRIAKLPSAGVPYTLLVLAGVLPWTFFSSAVSESASALISSANMVSKVYFPRLIVPVSAVIVAVVDLGISFSIFVVMLAFHRLMPDWRILFLPAVVLLALLAAIGPGVWLSALNVKYRDFRYVIPFLLQLGAFVSPVGFSSGVVPEEWRLLYSLNPMVGVIDAFRWCLLGGRTPLDARALVISVVVVLGCLVVGIRYFRATERGFADVI